jgi:hypothetical protein
MEIPISALASFTLAKTRSLISWNQLDALTFGFLERAARGAGAQTSPFDDPEKQRQLGALFDLFQQQCNTALTELRRSTRACVWTIIVAMMCAVAGAVVLAFLESQRMLGGVLTAGGLGALATVLARALGLARDEAMLQVLPTKYQLAFQLARDPKQYDEAYRAFLAETNSLRSSRQGERPKDLKPN